MLQIKAEVENNDIAKSGAKKCGVSLSCPSVAKAKKTMIEIYVIIPNACKNATFEGCRGFLLAMKEVYHN